MKELSIPLERQLVSIFAANRENAFETQRARACALMDVAQMLNEKFGLQKWANLGEKHVAHVISTWKVEEMCCSECRRKTKAGKTDRR